MNRENETAFPLPLGQLRTRLMDWGLFEVNEINEWPMFLFQACDGLSGVVFKDNEIITSSGQIGAIVLQLQDEGRLRYGITNKIWDLWHGTVL